jgi:hypothetical protein
MAFLLDEAIYVRAHNRPQEKRDEQLALGLLVGGERKRQHVRGRVESGIEETLECDLRHNFLVSGNGKPSIDHVENALRSPFVIFRIVKDTLKKQKKKNYMS